MKALTLVRETAAGHTARRVGLLLALVVAALAVLSLVLLSPVALAALNPDGRADWQRLANISQTYAAASAVLALLALGGVAVSLLLQAREMRANRAQTMRLVHIDILKMAMDDPLYMRAMGPPLFDDDAEERQTLFVNLLVSYWHMAYQLGETREPRLRLLAADLFAAEPGRRYWRVAGPARIGTAPDKRARRFHEILQEEYQRATGPPPAPEPEPPEPEPDAPAASSSHEPPNRTSAGRHEPPRNPESAPDPAQDSHETK